MPEQIDAMGDWKLNESIGTRKQYYSGSAKDDFEAQAQKIADGDDLRLGNNLYQYLPTRVISLNLAQNLAPKDQIAYGMRIIKDGTKTVDDSARPGHFLHWADTLKLESALIGGEIFALSKLDEFRSEYTWDVHPLSQDGLTQRVWIDSLHERQLIFRTTLLQVLHNQAGTMRLATFLAGHEHFSQEAMRMKSEVSRVESKSLEYLPSQDLEYGLFKLSMIQSLPCHRKRKSPTP